MNPTQAVTRFIADFSYDRIPEQGLQAVKMAILESAAATLGDPLMILENGLNYKLYPCCAGTHAAIDSALEIVNSHPVNPEEIREIAIHINPGVQFLLIHPRPKTGMEAKFSLDYCVARAILDRDITPEQFTEAKVIDPVLKTLICKVKPHWEENRRMDVKTVIGLINGQAYSSEVQQARGTTGNPLDWSDLEAKFLKYTANILDDETAREKLNMLRKFEVQEDISQFVGFKRA